MTNVNSDATAFQRRSIFTVIDGGGAGQTNAFQSLDVVGNCSSWVRALESRFEEVTALSSGWDGYAGKPVSFGCATFAANLLEAICIDSLPAPQLVPGSDGTLQLEWHLNGFDLELDVLGPNEVVAYRFNERLEIEETEELQNDFALVADWVDDLQRHPQVGQAFRA